MNIIELVNVENKISRLLVVTIALVSKPNPSITGIIKNPVPIHNVPTITPPINEIKYKKYILS